MPVTIPRPLPVAACAIALATPAAPQESAVGLARVLDSTRAAMGIPGVSAAMIFSDGRMWASTSGIAFDSVAVTPETVFEIGSITKTFTAALAVRLVDAGVLSLGDTLARWLPALPNAGSITLEQLLNHTSGMADVWDDPAFIPRLIAAPRHAWSPADVLALTPPPVFPPGAGWDYSSTAYVAIGEVLERATGRPLTELMREQLLAPLALTRTVYAATDSVHGARAHGFMDINGDGTYEDFTQLAGGTAFLTAAGSAGAVVSSASDIARWLHLLCTGDVVTDSSWHAMTTWVDRSDGNKHGLGLLRIELDGVVLIGHRGNSAGFSAAAWHVPDLGLTLAVLTNAHGLLVTPIVRMLLTVARAP